MKKIKRNLISVEPLQACQTQDFHPLFSLASSMLQTNSMKSCRHMALPGVSKVLDRAWVILFAGLTWVGSLLASDDLLPPMNGTPEDYAPRRAGAEVNAFIKITVTNEGLYQINQADLIAAGVETSALVGERLRLFCTTQEVAVVVSNPNRWTVTDSLVFFGKPFEGPQSEANVYWLGFGGTGKRMDWRSAAPLADKPDTLTCNWRVVYRKPSLLEEKYLPQNEQFDHWFSGVLSPSNALAFSIPADWVVTSRPATFSAELYGASFSASVDPDHCTRVKINGLNVGEMKFDGKTAFTGACVFPADRLDADNSFGMKQKPLENLLEDRVLLKEARLEYTRKLMALDDRLVFTGQPGTANYRVQGFSSDVDYWVMDVSDPDAPVLLSDSALISAKGRYGIRFGEDAPVARRYALWHPRRLQRPVSIEAVAFSGLAAPTRQADYLVICPGAFQRQAERLVEWRAAQGLSGRVVTLSAVYDEFSYGIADAGAIKQFLGYAYHHWQAPAPRYVVLAGSGSYDPKGYLLEARGAKSFKAMERIPLHMGPSQRMWTSLDGWFAQVDGGDKLPDLAVGRLPAQNVLMLSNMVDKIVAFESLSKDSPFRKKALLVADKADISMDAKEACEVSRTAFLAPGGYWCATAYSDDLSEAAVRRTLFDSVNAGVSLACYFGHGDELYWGDVILAAREVSTFNNKQFPVVLMMSCRNGALQNPLEGPCLAEAMLQGVGRGASACIANTATAYGYSDITFSQGFLRTLAVDRAPRLGDAFLGGLADLKAFHESTQELLYLNLFGDPAMVVNF